MKLAKLSLAAIVVAGLSTSSFAADTLADAFAKGKVSGELRAWYWDRDNGTTSYDLINTGLVLGYVTDSLYGFQFGTTMQSNFSPFADTDAKTNMNGASGEYGSGAVLSEAYVAYKMKNTSVKVGRQFMATPLVSGSGSRMIKQSYEGALLVNTDLPDTTLAAAVVTKYQNRTDGAGNAPKFNELNFDHDYAYTLLAINKSIPGLTLTGQWVMLDGVGSAKTDGYDLYYASAEYAGKASSFTYGLAGQYQVTDYATTTPSNGGYYGLKASLGMGALNAYVAYSQVDKDAAIYGLGGGADIIYTANIITGGNYTTDAKAYAIDANYAITPAAKIGARYADINVVAPNSDYRTLDIYASYAFDGALKGFGVEVQYEDKSADSAVTDTNELRFKANYKF